MSGKEPTTKGFEPQNGNTFADADETLWRQFGSSASQEVFCTTWLTLQCRMIPGVAGGVVLLGEPGENRPFAPVAFWPNKQQNLKHLSEASQKALGERRGVVLKRQLADDPSKFRYDIAYPLLFAGNMRGVVALDVDPRPEEALRNILRQLQWGSAWLEVLFYRSAVAKSSAPQERLQAIVNILATMVSQEKFHGAAVALVSTLATRFECDRVSIGFIKRGSIRVEALSHSAEFGKDTNLIRAIGIAMDEAADQESTITLPETTVGKVTVTRGHEDLAKQSGNGALCSIPLTGHSRVVGAITFERPANLPFDAETIELCQSVCALVGPLLEIQRRDDRWLLRKIFDTTGEHIGNLIGPRHVALKLSVVGVLAVVLFFSFAMGTYRVTAKSVIEPLTRQAVVAAFNGYIGEAPLRAGDVVRKGQVMAKMDDRELKLERGKWQSEQNQNQGQFYEALGNRNAAQVQILTSQIAQAKAQVALIDDQLARTEIIAPFEGIIVTGDLSQNLGAPVEKGQVLFELAPLDSYRIILQVDERQIADVSEGQHGRLVLSGFTEHPLDFTVKTLTPVSVSNEGRNFFRVEAQLQNVPDRLRPAMEGVGKIEIDRRRLIWIWTHEVIDWLRLKIWNWLP